MGNNGKIISVRLTTEEYRMLSERSAASFMTNSRYIRKTLNDSFGRDKSQENYISNDVKADALKKMLDISNMIAKKQGKIDEKTYNEIEGRLTYLWDALQ